MIGLDIALNNINKIITTIKTSNNSNIAHTNLLENNWDIGLIHKTISKVDNINCIPLNLKNYGLQSSKYKLSPVPKP
jgi:DNA gyrase/topoisomerase IV subunit A